MILFTKDTMKILNKIFYSGDTLIVARELLGKKLVRQIDGKEQSGMIVETEAYCGQTDSACHAHRGRTKRNAVMFGPPGHAYVYFTYGLHHLLNVVTREEGNPCAVLVRAIVPLCGLADMEARRKRSGKDITNGPAKLCQALDIDKTFNGWDLTKGSDLWIENYRDLPADKITTTPRIGIDYARREDREALWRFVYLDQPSSLSGKRSCR